MTKKMLMQNAGRDRALLAWEAAWVATAEYIETLLKPTNWVIDAYTDEVQRDDAPDIGERLESDDEACMIVRREAVKRGIPMPPLWVCLWLNRTSYRERNGIDPLLDRAECKEVAKELRRQK